MHAAKPERLAVSTSGDALGGRWLARWAGATLLACLVAGWGLAQEAGEAKEDKIPEPEELGGEDLVTSDGVQLKGTFFPGTEGKDTVPIILLHSWKGDRSEYAGFAQALQRRGHAVLVPDLRGHGDSTQFLGGGIRELDSSKMGSRDFEAMVYKDMEKFKGILVDRNDAGELNLSKLCIVGAEMGASVALYYAQYDWMLNRYEPASKKKRPSEDVKAVVLISPEWSFKGLPMASGIKHAAVQRLVSMLIIVGKADSKAMADARRLHKMIERYRPEPPPEERAALKNLFLIAPDTKLQGTKMLNVRGLDLERVVGTFINLRLANKDYAWRKRK
jgi:pimeloyl-ACP methyl ester carboxylesterase